MCFGFGFLILLEVYRLPGTCLETQEKRIDLETKQRPL